MHVKAIGWRLAAAMALLGTVFSGCGAEEGIEVVGGGVERSSMSWPHPSGLNERSPSVGRKEVARKRRVGFAKR